MSKTTSVPESNKSIITPPPSFNVRSPSVLSVTADLEKVLNDVDTLKHIQAERGREWAIMYTDLQKSLAYLKVYLG